MASIELVMTMFIPTTEMRMISEPMEGQYYRNAYLHARAGKRTISAAPFVVCLPWKALWTGHVEQIANEWKPRRTGRMRQVVRPATPSPYPKTQGCTQHGCSYLSR